MNSSIKALVLFSLTILFSGCIKRIEPDGVVFNHSAPELEILETACRDIEAEGSITELLASLKRSHHELLLLIDRPDPTQVESSIREVADSIKTTAESISTLVKPEWTQSKWGQTVTWSLDQKHG